jgi:DNA-binding response OmpR family regulator
MARAILLTGDEALADLVARATQHRLRIDVCGGPRPVPDLLAGGDTELLVLDDAILAEHERAWLLERVRRLDDAFVVYVASRHSAEIEKVARAHGVDYYTSRPIDGSRLELALRGWMRTQRAA